MVLQMRIPESGAPRRMPLMWQATPHGWIQGWDWRQGAWRQVRGAGRRRWDPRRRWQRQGSLDGRRGPRRSGRASGRQWRAPHPRGIRCKGRKRSTYIADQGLVEWTQRARRRQIGLHAWEGPWADCITGNWRLARGAFARRQSGSGWRRRQAGWPQGRLGEAVAAHGCRRFHLGTTSKGVATIRGSGRGAVGGLSAHWRRAQPAAHPSSVVR
jgi:hypothetical protein